MRRWLIACSVVVFLGVGAKAQAQSDGSPPPDGAPGPAGTLPIEIVHLYADIDVNADGTFVGTNDQLLLLKNQQGVQALRTAGVAYSESLQEGDLVQVYTIKPDGRRIDAPVDQAITRSSPMGAAAPMFDDIKIKVLAFQNVEVGDQVGIVTRVRQKTPLIPGQFSSVHVFGHSQIIRDAKVTVTAPKDYPLHLDVVGIDNKPPIVVDGKNQWTWTFKNDTPEPAEPGTVGEFDFASHVVMSSLLNYPALAKAYESRAREKAAVTPAIQELADKLTKGTKDKREQARRLYDWVNTNIKYVAINLGVGAIVPHAASEVLANLYGDCKDHVTLLQALLKAKGIDSSPALISAGTSFKMPTVAAMAAFNHVITYVPELKLYMDSTARLTPFGVLPPADADKTVLLTALGKLDHTPWDPLSNNFHVTTHIKVHDDGSADGESRIAVTGRLATLLRGAVAGVSPDQDLNFLRALVGTNAGTLERGDPEKLADPYEFGMHYTLQPYLQVPGPGAISFTAGPRLSGRIGGVISALAVPHKSDFMCASGHYVEDFMVELPPALKITSLPKPQDIAIEGIRLQASYAREGDQIVKGTRTLDVIEPHFACAADQIAALRADIVKMNGFLGAQALYE